MILITGTGTGVGKTFVTVSIVRALRRIGKSVCAFKIVETGCNPICEDAKEISSACGKEIKPVYSFKTPVAPWVASKIEGKEISVERIKNEMLVLSSKYKHLLFEGAGGLLVPITKRCTFLDLAKDLNMGVVVVALNKLGVINHTLLTVKACQCENVKVQAVILNQKEKFDKSVETNYEILRELLNVPVFPFSKSRDAITISSCMFP